MNTRSHTENTSDTLGATLEDLHNMTAELELEMGREVHHTPQMMRDWLDSLVRLRQVGKALEIMNASHSDVDQALTESLKGFYGKLNVAITLLQDHVLASQTKTENDDILSGACLEIFTQAQIYLRSASEALREASEKIPTQHIKVQRHDRDVTLDSYERMKGFGIIARSERTGSPVQNVALRQRHFAALCAQFFTPEMRPVQGVSGRANT